MNQTKSMHSYCIWTRTLRIMSRNRNIIILGRLFNKCDKHNVISCLNHRITIFTSLFQLRRQIRLLRCTLRRTRIVLRDLN